MDPQRRKLLRDRFLAEQQEQLAEDALLQDPAGAYRDLLAELHSHKVRTADPTVDLAEDEPSEVCERAA